ncbi:MAG TPA: tRNA (N(6)-L-threonylcarbamoyladenosine(37)-C(2))-methylthiotransferase MtaB [Alphaproteobacteria bacterium]|nr:tRNA (N(6)-L-threonylcarbamoyladenosine(37)-C(2))-methylthiotransferase MtaB [Alphaproteobacteria bacterium]
MENQVITFGCRLNSYESEVIKNNLTNSGLDKFVVFNTCSVTKEAERQAKQSIRKFIKANPQHKVVVTGCAAQIDPKSYSSIGGVYKVIGNEEKLKQETYQNLKEDFGTEKVLVNDIFSIKETASHLITSFEDKSRAFMQVQNGCNHRCTFCIIPYGRGNSRSVPIGEIVKQAKVLTDQGYKEIVLTGVDITDYGSDLPGRPRMGEMIKRLLKLVPDIKRIRLSSVDVAEIDDDIFWLLENEPRFMPHFHLSLQAGDDIILKRMKRRHLRADILNFVEKVRKIRSDIVFGADIIAGFPTEDDKMFENTLKIVSEVEIIYGHVFPYSKREGTPAAKIPENKQVPKQIRKERAKQLRDACDLELQKFLKTRIGKTENVIVEKGGFGRTEHFVLVKLANDNYVQGEIVTVKAGSVEENYLREVI